MAAGPDPIQRCTRPRLEMAALLALFCLLQRPGQAHAHAKGLYPSQSEAETRAQQLGCNGTHRNNGLWMPCSSEAMLHKELREE
jgi:hypothetical protein